jgi:predicted nucleic acid-binding protein
MKFVLDASVAVKWVLPEKDSDKALELCDLYLKSIHELVAPDSMTIEVAHALTRAERRGILKVGEAVQRLQFVLSNAPLFYSFSPLLMRATELSSQLRIAVSDCIYISLAEREDCDVVTADERLKASGHPRIILLADLP